MFDNFNEEVEKIMNTHFFSKMGVRDLHAGDIILIDNVRKVFITPCDSDFQGFYNEVEWLPSSPSQEDPFYAKQVNPKNVIDLRKEINKHVMDATKVFNKDLFIAPPHDFSLAARNAICYAFRQLVTESYFNLGVKWRNIVEIYYSGHWPVGYTKEKIIVV